MENPDRLDIEQFPGLTLEQKLCSAVAIWHSVCSLKLAYLRQRHPDAPETELRQMLNEACLAAGDDIAFLQDKARELGVKVEWKAALAV